MNTLFTRQTRPVIHEDETRQPQASIYLDKEDTNGFGFVLRGKYRPGAVPELTLDDRRELLNNNPRLGNMELNARAKTVFAAGGDTRAIKDACYTRTGKPISMEYAAKLHAAFSRAENAAISRNRKSRY